MFYNTDFLKNDEIFLRLDNTVKGNPEKQLVDYYNLKICLSSDGTEVGLCNFRVGNTQRLFFGGNIGYEIYEPYRGHYYSGKACMLLFDLARKHNMSYMYITCNPDNIGSIKNCEYAGGTLVATVDLPTDTDMYEEGERHKCIYRFSL